MESASNWNLPLNNSFRILLTIQMVIIYTIHIYILTLFQLPIRLCELYMPCRRQVVKTCFYIGNRQNISIPVLWNDTKVTFRINWKQTLLFPFVKAETFQNCDWWSDDICRFRNTTVIQLFIFTNFYPCFLKSFTTPSINGGGRTDDSHIFKCYSWNKSSYH